ARNEGPPGEAWRRADEDVARAVRCVHAQGARGAWATDARRRRQAAMMFFANARVFDGTGRAPFAGEALVKGNRIAAVGEAGTLPRGDAEVIDCGGATLMPGMVEAHAHLSWPSSVGRIFDSMVLPPE